MSNEAYKSAATRLRPATERANAVAEAARQQDERERDLARFPFPLSPQTRVALARLGKQNAGAGFAAGMQGVKEAVAARRMSITERAVSQRATPQIPVARLDGKKSPPTNSLS